VENFGGIFEDKQQKGRTGQWLELRILEHAWLTHSVLKSVWQRALARWRHRTAWGYEQATRR